MKQLITWIFINNWQRKLVAVVFAIIIWVLANNSIITTRTFSNVPIRMMHLPPDKTVEGYLYDGVLNRRITLTLTGTKDVIEELQSSELEVLVDAQGHGNEWVVFLNKNNVRSVNPDIDLVNNITEISHTDLFIRLENLVTEKIPVYISTPTGEPPQGYQFLDIWPRELVYTVSGPESQVKKLKASGVDLTFNLGNISKEQLDNLEAVHRGSQDDEITFYVPDSWKKVLIPFLGNNMVEINDSEAKYLHINFLRNSFLAIDQEIPISVFFPLQYSLKLNPDAYSLVINECVDKKNGVKVLSMPLFAINVSRLFLDVVRNNIEIIVTATPKSETASLPWSIEFVNARELETKYVNSLMFNDGLDLTLSSKKIHTEYLREKFRKYVRRFRLFNRFGEQLKLDIKLQDHVIVVTDATRGQSTEDE